MIDRALKSVPATYSEDNFCFLMNSVAPLEAEISTYFHERVGYVGPLVIPIQIEI